MDFNINRYYTEQQLSSMVRKAFGTRYYNRIVYSLIPLEDGNKKIIFDVTENALTFAKLGVHYNEFSGINLIANITSRNFFIPSSRDLLTLNIGQNVRVRAEHLQYIGRLKKFSLVLGSHFSHFEVGTYSNYKEDGVFAQQNFDLESRFQFSTNRNLTIGIGTRLQWLRYDPSISSRLEIKGQNRITNSFFYVAHNSLDRNIYPKKGIKLEGRAEFIYDQVPHISFSYNGEAIKNLDSAKFLFSPYQRTILNVEGYVPVNNKIVFLTQAHSGINFRYGQSIMNEFSIGGLTSQFPNQIPFAGLKEGSFYSSSVAALLMGCRYQFLNNTYIIAKSNFLFNNFIHKNKFSTSPDFLSGHSLTFAYNFALGPLELSAMYCDQSRKVRTYVNIGIPF
jgi:NTE family protein